MEEQTLHILNECSSGCKMAIHSMQQVLEYVENEKLEQVIMAAERKHKEIAARTAKALTSYGEKGKNGGVATKLLPDEDNHFKITKTQAKIKPGMNTSVDKSKLMGTHIGGISTVDLRDKDVLKVFLY